MVLTIIGFVLIAIGVLALIYEIYGIIKFNGFTKIGNKFVLNMVIGLLTLLLIAVGAILASGVIHL